MKYEDWVRYETRRKKGVSGALILFKIKKREVKKAPNREIVPRPKRHRWVKFFRNFLGG
jgi:hypothetical protein